MGCLHPNSQKNRHQIMTSVEINNLVDSINIGIVTGNPVNIRDDSQGHTYPDDPSQNRGPHFNDEAGNHYDY